ncbi:DUF222 domain-containing protein [Corynebacterium sp. NPDC060344]|uniref:DUF222 domain-containing protein n=1 Tax=Corynebacterium sp. NPDC060344 TaxID=3347101 RepID=UPI0036576984
MNSPAGCAADLLGAIDALAEAATVACGAWDRLAGDQREAAYRKLDDARKVLAVIDAEYLQARCDDSPIAESKMAAVVAHAQHISRAEARRRQACYRRLTPGHAAPGCAKAGRAANEAYMPCVREKVEAGVIGADAVEKIDRVLRGFPKSVQAELTAAADPHIAELVEHVEVDDLDHLAPMLRAMLGIDDPYTDADRKRARDVRVGVQGHDGMSKISGWLTPHLAAILKRLAADHGRPGGLLDEGARDERSPGQRMHDALEAALAAGFGKGAGPVDDGHRATDECTGASGAAGAAGSGGEHGANGGHSGATDEHCGVTDSDGEQSGTAGYDEEHGVTGPGVGPEPIIDVDFGARADTAFDHTIETAADEARDPPWRRGRLQPARGTTSIVVVATLDQLESMSGMVVSDTNVHMSVAEAVEHCDARNLFLSVLDFEGQPLYLGQNRRRGSLAQYLSLFAAEGMSSAPGSSAPAAWCHIHHTEGWQYGGDTDIDLLTLVDPKTHANVDDSRTDEDKWWTRKGEGPGEPRIVWQPPKARDPKRAPKENRHPAGWTNPGRTMRREATKNHDAQHDAEGGP